MGPISERLQSTVQTRLRERKIAGLAVCGFDAGGIRFAEGFGYADFDRAEAATSTTVFRAASISKLLTTTLLLSLVDAGKVDLDRPANTYLPPDVHLLGIDGEPAPSTVAMLASHTSGLPFGIRGAELTNPALSYLANRGKVADLQGAIGGLRLVHEPGARVVYSNPAFNVIGFLSARQLGVPFEDAVQTAVLHPLGMSDAAFSPLRRGPGVATPYGTTEPQGFGPKIASGMRVVATPMGGLTTHVQDLARFGQMVLGRGAVDGQRLLSEDTFDQATTLRARNHPDLDQGFGLGFKVRSWRGRTLIGHDGNMPGVSSQFLVSPDDGVGVAVLANGFALAVPHEIASLALEELIGLRAETMPGSPEPPEADPRELAEYGRRAEGTYRLRDTTPPGFVTTFTDAFTRARVTHETQGRLRVTASPGSDGPIWLLPHKSVGQYRVAGHVDGGTNAVIEHRPDGVHLWSGFTTHLHLPR